MTDDPIERGLAEAFGADSAEIPAASVLRILQARTHSQLGVHLDAPEPEDAPVKVTDETRALRDPSGRYQILGEIGRGAVGTVYMGRDQDLGRDVAMKVLRDEYAQRPDVLARFVEEAQIGGQLQHPGIVPVYELGLQAGERPYFAMKLVKGETLAAQLARRNDTAQDRRRLLGMFEQVCQTIAYAHARRVVHRDLKPANIMIGAFGEVQVVDWGFAKVLAKGGFADEMESVARQSERSVIETVRSREGSGSGSIAGSMLGTPAYMPPEQALGEVDNVDQRSDVFALGAILCEILTAAPPYREEDGDLVRQAASAALDGAHDRLSQCGADPSLVTLCIECLSSVRRARPESATEVAERIGAYLTSAEERARHAEVRAAEARYRNRVTLLGSAAAILLLGLGAGAWIWLQHAAQVRTTNATQRVATAMNATSRALGKAQEKAGGLDVTLWDTADARAESLAALVSLDDVEADVRHQAEALLDQVQDDGRAARALAARTRRDEAMLARLETLRIPTDDDVRAAGWAEQESRRLDAAYAGAFTEYLGGKSPLEQQTGPTLASLRGDFEVEVELATSLDHWALVRDALSELDEPPDALGTARIRDLAARLDPGDSWRSRLRALRPDAAHEAEQLQALAGTADFASLSAAGCRVLGEALWRAGVEDDAIIVLTRARETHPRDFDLCFQLAFHFELLAEPRWQDVVQTHRIANALRPGHNEVLHRQGRALEFLGRKDDAIRVWRTLCAREPENGHWFFHLGGALFEARDWPAAIENYRRAVELDPQDDKSLTNLGLALRLRGECLEAIGCYRRALESNPENITALHNLANALRATGETAEAVDMLHRALEIDPDSFALLMELGNALEQQGQHDQAIASYQRASEIEPRDTLPHACIAATLLGQGKAPEAIESYRRMLELEPDNPIAHGGLGAAWEALGRTDRAMESYQKAVDLAPRVGTFLNSLGSAFFRHQDVAKAQECFERAVAAEPRFAAAHISLGDMLRVQGDFDAAVRSYRAAIEIIESAEDPPPLLLTRDDTHIVQGMAEWAVMDPQQITPEIHAQAHNNLGTALWQLGQQSEAIGSFERALQVFPDYPNAHLNLGDALHKRGDLVSAVAHYESAERIFATQNTAFARQWGANARMKIGTVRGQMLRLDDVLGGRSAARSSDEWHALVQIGYQQKRFREVVALTENTLRDAPELIGNTAEGTYDSACSAALLATDDTTGLGADERARIRGLAREWLTVAGERWIGEVLQDDRRATEARGWLQHALQDRDFEGLRGAPLEALPEAEQLAWRALWSNIERASREDGR